MIAGTRITKVIRKSERPGMETWEQPFNGKTWEDMPTVGGYEHKLLDFALWRRGMYDPEFDLAVDAEDDEEEGVKTHRRTMGQRQYATRGRHGLLHAALAAAAAIRRADKEQKAQKDLDARYERQAELLVVWQRAKVQRGFVRAFYDADCTAHSALMRAMGRGRGLAGPLREVSLDRIERNFERLKEKGWKL
jgi:hypothetical protein